MAARTNPSALTWASVPRELLFLTDFSVHLAWARPMRCLGLPVAQALALPGLRCASGVRTPARLGLP